MIATARAVVTAALLGVLSPLSGAPRVEGASCDWVPPATRHSLRVRTTSELFKAVAKAKESTIFIEGGEYRLPRTLEIDVVDIVLAGASGDPAKVILRGEGMTDPAAGVAIPIGAPRVTIANLTVGYVRYHGIHIRGEAGESNAVLYNLHVVDTGQQLAKGSAAEGNAQADGGLLACSTLEYSSNAPSDYTNGIDVLAAKDWGVRGNRFFRIRGPEKLGWKAGPAILFWANSQNTRVEHNLVIDSYRGIAFSLGPGISRYARDGERTYDHQRGVIHDNVVVNRNPWADEGIELNAVRDIVVEGSVVATEGRLPRSISARFPETTAVVRNNRTTRGIVLRQNARAELEANVRERMTDFDWKKLRFPVADGKQE